MAYRNDPENFQLLPATRSKRKVNTCVEGASDSFPLTARVLFANACHWLISSIFCRERLNSLQNIYKRLTNNLCNNKAPK